MHRLCNSRGGSLLAIAVASASSVLLAAVPAQAKEKVLYVFTGSTDASYPMGRLLIDKSGNLIGTSYYGGTNNLGTVFVVTPKRKETILYSFAGADGANPDAGLIPGSDGNYYGTTFQGGAHNLGTVFQITPAGKEAVLYSFSGGTDGGNPQAPLIEDDAGNFYGTAEAGGDATANDGVVFKLAPDGTQTVLHAFLGGDDGATPRAGLLMDAKKNLYGTTWVGGASFGGVVFEVSAKGKETVLYPFTRGNDGGQPEAGLIADQTGDLFGTTYYYGSGGDGVVFELKHKGKVERVLHAFAGGTGDGSGSYGVLAMDSTGALYGTTVTGGQYGLGTVFRLTPRGKETVLHDFAGGNDGSAPKDLTMDAKGNLYGVTQKGGQEGVGTLFEITARK
jgi:uncharacterized repeat protein (TIGR03803 family)